MSLSKQYKYTHTHTHIHSAHTCTSIPYNDDIGWSHQQIMKTNAMLVVVNKHKLIVVQLCVQSVTNLLSVALMLVGCGEVVWFMFVIMIL